MEPIPDLFKSKGGLIQLNTTKPPVKREGWNEGVVRHPVSMVYTLAFVRFTDKCLFLMRASWFLTSLDVV